MSSYVQYPPTQFVQTYNIISKKYEIDACHNENIMELANYHIYFLIDDSGSMNYNTNISTRWSELKIMVKNLTELCNSVNPYGVNILFINKLETYNITNYYDINNILLFEPSGSTPTCSKLQRIFDIPSELPKLIVLFTDGCPTMPNSGTSDVNNFYNLMKNRNAEHNRVSIIVCTDNDDDVAFLNRIDNEAKYVDVVDDYNSEKKEIMQKQGNNFPFSRGDYLIKSLLGPINPIYDYFDEKKIEIIIDTHGNRKMQYVSYDSNVNNNCIIL